MTNLIREMAQIDVPGELLEQIDMPEVLTKFRRSFGQLGDLSKAREKHEKRNSISRWWHKDELKNAQLDAQEVQAEFSKTVGQLLVISMLQSQRLEKQQTQLSKQQDEIKRQADSIAAHTNALEKQHETLHNQAEELKNLVTQYFELRGLTQEGAKKLIAIATEVKSTKDELLETVERRVQEVLAHGKDLEYKFEASLTNLGELFEGRTAELRAWSEKRDQAYSARCSELEANTEQKIGLIRSDLSIALQEEKVQRVALTNQANSLAVLQGQHKRESEDQFGQVMSLLGGAKAAFEDYRLENGGRFAQSEQLAEKLDKAIVDQRSAAAAEMQRLKRIFGSVIAVMGAALGYAYYVTIL